MARPSAAARELPRPSAAARELHVGRRAAEHRCAIGSRHRGGDSGVRKTTRGASQTTHHDHPLRLAARFGTMRGPAARPRASSGNDLPDALAPRHVHALHGGHVHPVAIDRTRPPAPGKERRRRGAADARRRRAAPGRLVRAARRPHARAAAPRRQEKRHGLQDARPLRGVGRFARRRELDPGAPRLLAPVRGGARAARLRDARLCLRARRQSLRLIGVLPGQGQRRPRRDALRAMAARAGDRARLRRHLDEGRRARRRQGAPAPLRRARHASRGPAVVRAAVEATNFRRVRRVAEAPGRRPHRPVPPASARHRA